MNLPLAEKIANAVLYEGYMLYPYTASSLKNQQRWNFGVLYPACYDTSEMRTECLAQAAGVGRLRVKVRFLQAVGVDTVERTVEIELSVPGNARQVFAFGTLRGELEVSAVPLKASLFGITAGIRNTTEFAGAGREEAMAHSMLSTHTILMLEGGEFLSLMDPPEEQRTAAAACTNQGTYPVLVGNEGERDMLLSSPIILYDYPQIAPESPGDLFDSTEIDEILTLRILTLSDEEKAEIRSAGGRANEILARTESLPPEHLAKLHGAWRGLPRPVAAGTRFQAGDRVRLHPRRRADIFDIALMDKVGIVEAVEQDFEGQVHLAIVVEDDPGRDLGMMRQTGHRFFFTPDEVEPLT